VFLKWLLERVINKNKLTNKKAEKIEILRKAEIKKKMCRIVASQKTKGKMIGDIKIVNSGNT
jgi:hypothetical protein